MAKGFTVGRQTLTLNGESMDESKLRQTDRFIVVLSGSAGDGAFRRAVVADPLPAGLEIEAPVLREETYPFLGQLTPLRAHEERDDRFMAAFDLGRSTRDINDSRLNALDPGEYRVAYVVRAVTPGPVRAAGNRGAGHVPAGVHGPHGGRPDQRGAALMRRLAWLIGVPLLLLATAVIFDRVCPPDLGRAHLLSAELRDASGRVLNLRVTPDGAIRLAAGPDEVGADIVPLLLGREDRRFWDMPGVDPLALARAARQLVWNGRIVSGGSTIAMQVARLLEPHPRTMEGKLHDIVRALQLQAHFSKPEILRMYLTLAPMGGNIEGFRAASLLYFGCEPAALTRSQAALLVGLPQSPARRRPDLFPTAAWRAAARVLAVDGDTAPIVPTDIAKAPLPALARHLAARGTGRTDTTLDADLQAGVEALAARENGWLGPEANIAALMIRNSDRAVLAYLGGSRFFGPAGMVDMVRTPRSPGSALKPFIYAMAFDRGLALPDTLLDDSAMRLGGYAPRDFDRAEHGAVTAAEALRQSLNRPAVRLLSRVGAARFAARLGEAGAMLRLPRGGQASAALALGGAGITLFDLASLYADMAVGGSVHALHLFGKEIATPNSSPVQVASPHAAGLIADILRAEPAPPGITADPGHPIAYKTGTSYGFRDAWAAGFTPGYTVVVWVGRLDNTPRPGAMGREVAAPILFRLFALLPGEAPVVPCAEIAAATPLAPGLTRGSGRAAPAHDVPAGKRGPGLRAVSRHRPARSRWPPALSLDRRRRAPAWRDADPLDASRPGFRPPHRHRPRRPIGIRRRPDGHGMRAIALTRGALARLAAIALLAVWHQPSSRSARRDVLAHSEADRAAIGRHFVVGYHDLATARELVRAGRVGGVFLTTRNVAGRTTRQVGAEVVSLQAMRREAGLPPLIVAADQEGGPVSRLSPPLPAPPSLSSLAVPPASEQRLAARRLGIEQGLALKQIGITMDLAPVVDLTPSTAPGWLDWNTRIGTRSISGDPDSVAAVAAGFSEGLIAAGVTPTAKHFPGLGRVTADTHLFSASLDVGQTALSAADWVPFQAVLSLRGAAVMLSHVAMDRIDPGIPASQSRRIVTSILRQQWGFGGVAITDDLTMGAIVHTGLCRAVERGLNAGVDLLLVAWDTDDVYPALQCGLAALAAGWLDPAMLDASARRLKAFAPPGYSSGSVVNSSG